ncbi:MAG: hypothetical protein OXP09_00890 [Gammaproteobacteria bacterium]|nr:hypothetical protein [Gammaproteobacteria bacterium]
MKTGVTISGQFGGGLPISTVRITDAIAEGAVNQGRLIGRSHAADPLLCAASEESINIVVEKDTVVSCDIPVHAAR